jgi:mannose-6-phosphate isomerase-like protein (cupin superfamily)
MSDYKIVKGLDAKDYYEDSDVPGEFRRLTDLLSAEQVGLTLIRVPAHSDFEQGTGHYHEQIEEIYLITKGELTMRFNDDIIKVTAGSAVRVSPKTTRSHRNEGDEMVEMWAISKQLGHQDATKVDNFWEASDQAKQQK